MKRILSALMVAALMVMFAVPVMANDEPEPPPDTEKVKSNSGHAYGKVNNGKFGGEVDLTNETDEGDIDPGMSGFQAQGGKNTSPDGSGSAD